MELKLEDMVDHYGLRAVIEALAEVCRAKAEHLQDNWQDYRAARPWLASAARLDGVASKE